MPSRYEKQVAADEEAYTMSDLVKVTRGTRPTQSNIIEAKKAIGRILAGISNTIPNTGNYGYAFIIYTDPEWLALGNALQVVAPADPPAFGGGDMAARYAYEASRITFAAYKRHKDATVRMILHIFGTVVFLNLQDIHGFVVGHTPRELMAHLENTYVTPKQRRDDISAMDMKMRLPYSMDEMIEEYFMKMTSARFTLAALNNPMDDAEMIRLCLVQFILNEEMNEPCEKWEDSPLARTYLNFREFFIKQAIRIEGRKGTQAQHKQGDPSMLR